MKRSEAIFWIKNCLSPYFNVTDTYEKNEAAESILTTLVDEFGMLPPDNGKEAGDILEYRSKCLRWEPEDV